MAHPRLSAAITDIASALHWLRSTFLFVRIKKNPRYYAIANGAATSPDARLEEIVVESVKALVNEGIVDESDDTISPTSERRLSQSSSSTADWFLSSLAAYGDVRRAALASPRAH